MIILYYITHIPLKTLTTLITKFNLIKRKNILKSIVLIAHTSCYQTGVESADSLSIKHSSCAHIVHVRVMKYRSKEVRE